MSEFANKIFSVYKINVKKWSKSRCFMAVLSHELLGFGILSGAWIFCYKYRPLEHIIRRLPKVISSIYHNGVTWSAAKTKKLPNAVTSRTNPERLLVSGAESYLIRKLISPLTVPLKIYLAVILSSPFDINTSI